MQPISTARPQNQTILRPPPPPSADVLEARHLDEDEWQSGEGMPHKQASAPPPPGQPTSVSAASAALTNSDTNSD